MWWRRRTETREQHDDTGPDANLPLIRLEGVSKVFKGDADEETWALRDVTVDIGRGEYISVFGPVRLREIDVSGRAGAPRIDDSRALLAERAPRRSAVASRARQGAKRRNRTGLSELQSHRRHDGLRERRVPADAAGRRRSPPDGAAGARARRPCRTRQTAARPAFRRSPAVVAVARAIAGRPQSSWPTNRPAIWIRRAAKRSCRCCPSSMPTARQSASPPTTPST